MTRSVSNSLPGYKWPVRIIGYLIDIVLGIFGL